MPVKHPVNSPRAGKPRPCFRAGMKPDGTLEIVIYEEIGEDYWYGGGVTAKTIKEKLDYAGNYSQILMRINSPGGDAFEGIAIYNLIRAQGKPVEVCVDGIAASAASIIAMAGDTVTMGPNTMMMIHNAWAICMGEAADMRKMADALDKISTSIAQTYVTKTQKPLEEVTAMMLAETWLTAQECVDQGFATRITPLADEQIEQNSLALARAFKSLGQMKAVPAALKPAAAAAEADLCECPCEFCRDGDCAECDNVECEDLNCEDCPMQQQESEDASNLSLYEARAKMLVRT